MPTNSEPTSDPLHAPANEYSLACDVEAEARVTAVRGTDAAVSGPGRGDWAAGIGVTTELRREEHLVRCLRSGLYSDREPLELEPKEKGDRHVDDRECRACLDLLEATDRCMIDGNGSGGDHASESVWRHWRRSQMNSVDYASAYRYPQPAGMRGAVQEEKPLPLAE